MNQGSRKGGRSSKRLNGCKGPAAAQAPAPLEASNSALCACLVGMVAGVSGQPQARAMALCTNRCGLPPCGAEACCVTSVTTVVSGSCRAAHTQPWGALGATLIIQIQPRAQAMLLSDANEKLDPMSLLFYMSRWPSFMHGGVEGSRPGSWPRGAGAVRLLTPTSFHACTSVLLPALRASATHKRLPLWFGQVARERNSSRSYPLCPRSFSVLLLLPATALLEPTAFARTHEMMTSSRSFFWWLLFNSCMAYAVNLTNFMVTKFTSALTLQVRGLRGSGVLPGRPALGHRCSAF